MKLKKKVVSPVSKFVGQHSVLESSQAKTNEGSSGKKASGRFGGILEVGSYSNVTNKRNLPLSVLKRTSKHTNKRKLPLSVLKRTSKHTPK